MFFWILDDFEQASARAYVNKLINASGYSSTKRRLMLSIAVSIPFARRRESVLVQLFQLVMLKLTAHRQQK